MQLQFLDGPTIEQAVAVADSLVVLDAERWEALLFPSAASDGSGEEGGARIDQLTSTTTATDESPGGFEPCGPACGTVTSRIELSTTTVAAGDTITGEVIVNNDTGSPITVIGCGQLFAVGVVSDTIDEAPFSADCGQTFVIPEAESTWPVLLITTFVGCTDDPDTDPDDSPMACLPGPTGGAPALPRGSYRAVVAAPEGAPTPDSIEVTIT